MRNCGLGAGVSASARDQDNPTWSTILTVTNALGLSFELRTVT